MSTSEAPRIPVAARVPILVAASIAVICVLAVGRRNSSNLLVTLFVLWVFAPFAVLALLVKSSRSWAGEKRVLLQRLSLSICAASASVYGVVAFGVQVPRPAFWFLITPLGSLCVIGVAYLVGLRGGAQPSGERTPWGS